MHIPTLYLPLPLHRIDTLMNYTVYSISSIKKKKFGIENDVLYKQTPLLASVYYIRKKHQQVFIVLAHLNI